MKQVASTQKRAGEARIDLTSGDRHETATTPTHGTPGTNPRSTVPLDSISNPEDSRPTIHPGLYRPRPSHRMHQSLSGQSIVALVNNGNFHTAAYSGKKLA